MSDPRIAEDFRSALERLRDGTQTHPKLAGRRVRISASVLALEARHSRNTLYASHKNLLEQLRALPPGARPRKPKPRDHSTGETLREENARLRLALRQSATAQVALFERMLQYQRRCEFLERQRNT